MLNRELRTVQMVENEKGLLWRPGKERILRTLLSQFSHQTSGEIDVPLDGYDEIWKWSVDNPDAFWLATAKFCKLIARNMPDQVFSNADSLQNVRCFPGAQVNFAENCLTGRSGPAAALIFENEEGQERSVSYDDLRKCVSSVQQALESIGFSKGDRVGAVLPNFPEAVEALLGVSSLGGVWASCSPEFGAEAICDRFQSVEPSILFICDGYTYKGKWIDTCALGLELARRLRSVRHVVLIPFRTDADCPEITADRDDLKIHVFEDWQSTFLPRPLRYTPCEFNDPLYILFSSGTTGRPKCMVHRVGGVLLQHLKEHQLLCDIHPGDRIFYHTTLGWMMWNWMVSALASGASLVLYDGFPFFPEPDRLLRFASRRRITHFGTSAAYLNFAEKQGVRSDSGVDLSDLRVILSTGSPLSDHGFEYVYRDWKSDVCLSSISGGTDIVGLFAGGNPIGPVWSGECQKRALGMDVQVLSADGDIVGSGVAGELVCRSAHPTIPLCFLDDADSHRFYKAYFSRFPGVWHQSDYIRITENQGIVFLGRSDSTLNPSGVRIGSAEIYRPLSSVREVVEAVAVCVRIEEEDGIALFVQLRFPEKLDDRLRETIREMIRNQASPRHVPARIEQVTDIPRSRSGKISESSVLSVLKGQIVENRSALSNPESLNYFLPFREKSDHER